jgi:hypothetical protein
VNTLYLHIGTKKSGSSSIQRCLKKNRHFLRSRGYYVSRELGQREDQALRLAFEDGSRLGHPAVSHFVEGYTRFDPRRSKSCIISCESLVDLDKRAIEALATEFRSMFGRFVILLYVRRQDRLAVSHYSTALRGGSTSRRLYSVRFGRSARAAKYGKIVADWAEVFGKEALRVHRYERTRLKGGDVVEDFLHQLGLTTADLQLDGRTNTALSADEAAFLLVLNRLRKQGRWTNRGFLRAIRATARAKFSGGPRAFPSRRTALAFFESFADENELVRREFFSSEPTLFDDSFDVYAEEATRIDGRLSPEQVAEVFLEAAEPRR